jgi:hypothetical protein
MNHEHLISARAAALYMKTSEWQVVARTGERSKNLSYDNLQLLKTSTGCLLHTGLVCGLAIALSLPAYSGREYLHKNLQNRPNIK